MYRELAIITGASSGIGKEFAYQLAAKKINLYLIGRNKVELDTISKELSDKYKIDVNYFICDLSKENEITTLEGNITIMKNITYLVNCAGFGNSNLFIKMNNSMINDMINVHIAASTRLIKAVLDNMINNNQGYIINVASVAGFIRKDIGNILYNSTKSYLISLSENLQAELNNQKINIKVQALCPGFTRTNFHNKKTRTTNFLWQEPSTVVSHSLKALNRKKVICISGWLNKVLVWILKNRLLTNIFFLFKSKIK